MSVANPRGVLVGAVPIRWIEINRDCAAICATKSVAASERSSSSSSLVRTVTSTVAVPVAVRPR